MDKVISKSESNTSIINKFSLPLAPVSFFAMTLGLAETGNAWRNASVIWKLPVFIGEFFEILAVISFVWWITVYINKWISHKTAAVSELKDPVQSSFIALIPESIILVALAIHTYNQNFAISIFWIGSVLNLLYGAFKLSQMWTQERPAEHVTPSLFLTYTASIMVNALAAGVFGYISYGFTLLGIGTISWIIMDSVIMQQLTVGGLSVRTRNFMGIYMAPSVVLFTAYLGLSGSGFNLPFAYALMGYALFILAALTFSLKWLKQQAFAPGYWAYTFGIATLSQGLSAFTAVNSNINGLALTVFILMNIVTLSVMIGSVKLVIKGSYFPK
ncbi:hypothetical protein [Flavobacterium johnsoniae]|uniref:Tellurite resistance protein n=1 Tax=Flavobacterium johnsoniae TaxID=986 RepID=A0A1J7C2Y2_FLAJO|nr:hypothetical protein [Flavobacterium johnsoniae]OIV40057.1 hypothetical protein BKM63_19050 [Flavobacterium johnsoniae]